MGNPTTRTELIKYCLRQLGEPVIEVNIEEDQIQDRVDEGLQYFQEFHSDATLRTYLKHLVTQTDLDNGYIDISQNVMFVSRLFPLGANSASSKGMFSVQYQMHLNDFANMYNFSGGISYFNQMQQYMSLLDMQFNGVPQVNFTRHQDRLYIYGDFKDGDIQVGDYIIAEIYEIIDPETNTSIYNDMLLKEYITALFKRQWGQNMSKFDGMQLPGGVTISGREILQEAKEEIVDLRERIRSEHEYPVDFFVG